ncbi:MAG: WD40 repeat domain-containing protein [Spirochaetales bacterium]|nr:WD40 repeat domain-containing protein [Spirochaetales bacterium]
MGKFYLTLFVGLVMSLMAFSQEPELIIQNGDFNGVKCVDVSPDNEYILTGSSSGNSIKIWERKTGFLLTTLRCAAKNDYSFSLVSVKFTEDSKYIVSAGSDGTIEIHETRTGALFRSINSGSVNKLILTKDGSLIIHADKQGKLLLWSIKSGELVKTISAHEKTINSLIFSRDGKLLVTGSDDKKIKVWTIPEFNLLKEIDNTYSVESVSISIDGKYIFSGDANGRIHLWDFDSGKHLRVLNIHTKSVDSIECTSDNKFFISGSSDGSVIIWNLLNFRMVHRFFHKGEAASGHAMVLSHDDSYIVSAVNKELSLYHLPTQKEIFSIGNNINVPLRMTMHPAGRYLITANIDQNIRIWDMTEGALKNVLHGHDSVIFTLTMTADGNKIVSSSGDGSIKTWDFELKENLQSFKGNYELSGSSIISFDDKYLFTSYKNYMKVWDLQAGKFLKHITGQTGSIYDIAVSPDGKSLASAGESGEILIRDIPAFDLVRTIDTQAGPVSQISFSPDSRFLASGNYDHNINVWNVETEENIKTLNEQGSRINSLMFSKKNPWIISSRNDGIINIWDFSSGERICKMGDPLHPLRSVIQNPLDSRIYAITGDAIIIWDPVEEKRIATILSLNTDDYIIYTDDNYYACSEGAVKYISFRSGNGFLKRDDYESRFRKPELIRQRLLKDKLP